MTPATTSTVVAPQLALNLDPLDRGVPRPRVDSPSANRVFGPWSKTIFTTKRLGGGV